MDENQSVENAAPDDMKDGNATGRAKPIAKDNVVTFSTAVNRSSQHSGGPSQPEIVSFNRRELDQILRVYGFKVAEGEWRDYAIDMLKDRAIFSVYRRTSEVPMHCIEKVPKLSRKQGAFAVTGADGRVLKRGHDLENVLKVFEKKPRLRLV